MQDNFSRREFLAFMGRAAVGVEAMLLAGAGGAFAGSAIPFSPVGPSDRDVLILADGLEFHSILKWGDSLNARGDLFGANNDFLAYFPLSKNDGLLWSNHEAPPPLCFTPGFEAGKDKTAAQVAVEQLSVGGSIARLRRNPQGKWALVPNDTMNRRLTGLTEIPFAWSEPIAGSRTGVGTFGNCAGGSTPWGSLLTCEENYQDFYGEVGRNGERLPAPSLYGWEKFQKRDPRHYGWVVEVDVKTGQAKKLVALGRFAHECATVVKGNDGRLAVYMGDDAEDRCFYKFISDHPGSLERGTLFVADMINGRGLPLDREIDPKLKQEFATQTELLIHTRLAAELVGGTPLHRPEDVAVDPLTGAIFLTLTNSAKRNDPYGQIAKVVERRGNVLGRDFEFSTFAAGGIEAGFASPDNLEFDRRGNLWMTSDVSGKSMNKGEYKSFGNNGLYYIPTQGKHAGKAFRAATAPNDAEFTGPCFTPDGETLFLSVQHPGELSTTAENPTSRWPDGGKSIPRSMVVGLTGRALQNLV